MRTPLLPDVRDGVPPWVQAFLRAVRQALMALVHGVPDRMNRAVTFRDLVEMGLAPQEVAERQAQEGR